MKGDKIFWMDDEHCSICFKCAAAFSTFKRKHHCRYCGRVFCDSCSSFKIANIAFIPYKKLENERLCQFCYVITNKALERHKDCFSKDFFIHVTPKKQSLDKRFSKELKQRINNLLSNLFASEHVTKSSIKNIADIVDELFCEIKIGDFPSDPLSIMSYMNMLIVNNPRAKKKVKVTDKTFVCTSLHAQKKYKNGAQPKRVVIFGCSLDFETTSTYLIHAQSSEYYLLLSKRILKYEPDLIIVQNNISLDFRNILTRHNIPTVYNVSFRDIYIISRITNASICYTPEEVQFAQIGICKSFKIKNVNINQSSSTICTIAPLVKPNKVGQEKSTDDDKTFSKSVIVNSENYEEALGLSETFVNALMIYQIVANELLFFSVFLPNYTTSNFFDNVDVLFANNVDKNIYSCSLNEARKHLINFGNCCEDDKQELNKNVPLLHTTNNCVTHIIDAMNDEASMHNLLSVLYSTSFKKFDYAPVQAIPNELYIDNKTNSPRNFSVTSNISSFTNYSIAKPPPEKYVVVVNPIFKHLYKIEFLHYSKICYDRIQWPLFCSQPSIITQTFYSVNDTTLNKFIIDNCQRAIYCANHVENAQTTTNNNNLNDSVLKLKNCTEKFQHHNIHICTTTSVIIIKFKQIEFSKRASYNLFEEIFPNNNARNSTGASVRSHKISIVSNESYVFNSFEFNFKIKDLTNKTCVSTVEKDHLLTIRKKFINISFAHFLQLIGSDSFCHSLLADITASKPGVKLSPDLSNLAFRYYFRYNRHYIVFNRLKNTRFYQLDAFNVRSIVANSAFSSEAFRKKFSMEYKELYDKHMRDNEEFRELTKTVSASMPANTDLMLTYKMDRLKRHNFIMDEFDKIKRMIDSTNINLMGINTELNKMKFRVYTRHSTTSLEGSPMVASNKDGGSKESSAVSNLVNQIKNVDGNHSSDQLMRVRSRSTSTNLDTAGNNEFAGMFIENISSEERRKQHKRIKSYDFINDKMHKNTFKQQQLQLQKVQGTKPKRASFHKKTNTENFAYKKEIYFFSTVDVLHDDDYDLRTSTLYQRMSPILRKKYLPLNIHDIDKYEVITGYVYLKKTIKTNFEYLLNLYDPGSVIRKALSVFKTMMKKHKRKALEENTTYTTFMQGQKHFEIEMLTANSNSLTCKILYAKEFYALRKHVFNMKGFALSLSECTLWKAPAGKSGLAFYVSTDDRFVLKEVSHYEYEWLTESAYKYINYQMRHLKKLNQPTLLVNIYCVFEVLCRGSVNYKRRFIIMENLLNIPPQNLKHTSIYDLKGVSKKSKKVKNTNHPSSEENNLINNVTGNQQTNSSNGNNTNETQQTQVNLLESIVGGKRSVLPSETGSETIDTGNISDALNDSSLYNSLDTPYDEFNEESTTTTTTNTTTTYSCVKSAVPTNKNYSESNKNEVPTPLSLPANNSHSLLNNNANINLTTATKSHLNVKDDHEFLFESKKLSVYMTSEDLDAFKKTLNRDVEFLVDNQMMDYSLLVVMDNKTNKVRFKLLDILRKYTWDKKIESVVKSGMVGILKNPEMSTTTIMSPEKYAKRFHTNLNKYFLPLPKDTYNQELTDEDKEPPSTVQVLSLEDGACFPRQDSFKYI